MLTFSHDGLSQDWKVNSTTIFFLSISRLFIRIL